MDVFFSESVSQDGESWIWQMMRKDIQNKSKPEETQRLIQGVVKYICEHCEYRAKKKHHLEIHTQAAHEGVRFHCNLCSYRATRIANLSSHKKHRHQGVIFSCKECGHESGSSSGLQYHTRSAHDGEKLSKKSYKCNRCEYASSKRSDLRKHMNRHGGI